MSAIVGSDSADTSRFCSNNETGRDRHMASFQDIQQRERGLQQHLTSAQMVMIAIGGAVGTGLFMGSAGPAKPMAKALPIR